MGKRCSVTITKATVVAAIPFQLHSLSCRHSPGSFNNCIRSPLDNRTATQRGLGQISEGDRKSPVVRVGDIKVSRLALKSSTLLRKLVQGTNEDF